MLFFVFGQEEGLVLFRLVELLVFEFYMLEEGPIRTIASCTLSDGTNKIPFDFICGPSVSFFAVMVVLDSKRCYFDLFEALVEDIFFRVDKFELISEDIVLANEADVGLVELVEGGMVLKFEWVDGQGIGAGD